MPNYQNDLIGKQFTRLKVIEKMKKRDKHRNIIWKCRCVCDNISYVRTKDLKSGHIKSCGCLRKEAALKANTKHGMHLSKEYSTYYGMKQRCENPNRDVYPFYGGRGIRCRFKSFEEFYAEIGTAPDVNSSVDRIDNNGHYEKGNVRWATAKQQANNRRKRYGRR